MLFNQKVLEEKITHHGYNFSLDTEYKKIFKKWISDNRKEESIKSDFLNDIFGKVLGYEISTDEEIYNLDKEQTTQKDSTKPDGILGYFSLKKKEKDIRVVIEIKGKNTKNLDTVEKQAFEYKDKIENVEWVIISNILELRLYHSSAGGRLKYESFELSKLQNDTEEIKKFQFLLSKEKLFTKENNQSSTYNLFHLSKKREKEIENKFYEQYSQIRMEIFEDLKKSNIKKDKNLLLSKTQKILDRFIFICFVEQYEIISEKTISNIDKHFTQTIWESLKILFDAFNTGNKRLSLPEINGGLFKEDLELNSLEVSDKSLKKLIDLSKWNFASDLSINILGHIFEQSISDLEKEKAKIDEKDHDLKKGKQKKDGIFYTPEYITHYIVHETLGNWILEKRKNLKLNEIKEEDKVLAKTKKKNLTNKEKQAKRKNKRKY